MSMVPGLILKFGLLPLWSGIKFLAAPKNLIVWVPVAAACGALIFAGVQVHKYIKSSEAAHAQVLKQQGQITALSQAVQDERASVILATQQMQKYEDAVNDYTKSQEAIRQQIGALRTRLAPQPIITRAQTDVQGADADLNAGYSSMLGMFDNATRQAAAASRGSPDSGEAPAAAGSGGPH